MKKLLIALLSLLSSAVAYAGPAGKFGDPTDTLNEYVFVKNADDVAHEVGDVVVWSDITAMTISTTTSADNNMVAGVVAFNDIAAGGKGFILVYGYTSAVPITVATAAGDMLSTSTTGESAKVNNSGEATAVFGTATEVTTTSTTVKAFIRCK